jgi:hypothetical protein
MEGVLLKLHGDDAGNPGKWFWKLFEPIRQDVDRMYWYVDMQTPPLFEDGDLLDVGAELQAIVICPGRFAHFGDKFSDEFISLWAMEPTRDEPAELVADYLASRHNKVTLQQHARIWLLYTDSSCWELYARKSSLVDRVCEGLESKDWVTAYRGESDRREQTFKAAGLSRMWRCWS